ncbi:MAG: type IV toxin-antitoxin system AbiEi family antitoxin [Candidatus Rokuibacteriota bacterium]
MLKSGEIRRQAVQRLRELFPKAKDWTEATDARTGNHHGDLRITFHLGEQEHSLVLEVCSLGQPRQIRAAVTRLSELRRELPSAYPMAAAVYIGPQSARILKSNSFGYIDLSGNCYLALENVHIEKEGKRNVRPSTRPLRSLFAPRATRVVRVLLAEPARAWKLEELARAAEVSLGHSHNVIKRLEELAWVDRDDRQRIRLAKAADLLENWGESYTYRENEISSYFVPARVTRTFMADVARAATAAGQRYAFSLNAGLSLVAPHMRLPAVHCYLEGDPAVVAAALGLRPTPEGEGGLHLLTPYDPGVFHGALEKAGLKVVCLPQLYVDLLHYERKGTEQAEHLRREAMGY